MLRKAGRKKEAELAFRDAIQHNPSNAIAYLNLGNVLFILKKKQESILMYRKAIEHDCDLLQAYVNLGSLLIEMNRCSEAIDAFQQVLNRDPTHKDAKLGMLIACDPRAVKKKGLSAPGHTHAPAKVDLAA